MLRLTLVILLTICCFQPLLAQKNEISEAEFLAKESFATGAIDRSSRRLVRSLEYFEDRSKTGRLAERYTEEVLPPNKWRRIEEKDYNGQKIREERLWDGSAFYVRLNEGEWKRYLGGASGGARIESGRITKAYRYLGKSELDGKTSRHLSSAKRQSG